MSCLQVYTTDCKDVTRIPIFDVEDDSIIIGYKWKCDWHGVPIFQYLVDKIICTCPSCGYSWSIGYREWHYGGGFLKGDANDYKD